MNDLGNFYDYIKKSPFLRRDTVPSFIRALSVVNCFSVPVGEGVCKGCEEKEELKRSWEGNKIRGC